MLFASCDFANNSDGYLPMSAALAQEIAAKEDMLLPTPEVVDEIYRQSQCQIYTRPKDPANLANIQKQSTEALKQKASCPDKSLVDGHYKSITVRGNEIGLYGWYTRTGERIQNFFPGHSLDYVDYSHGLRLIYKKGIDINTKKIVDVAEIIYN